MVKNGASLGYTASSSLTIDLFGRDFAAPAILAESGSILNLDGALSLVYGGSGSQKGTWLLVDAGAATRNGDFSQKSVSSAALKGDFFWGTGKEAGELAGTMKQRGSLWLLWPKDSPLP